MIAIELAIATLKFPLVHAQDDWPYLSKIGSSGPE